FDNIQGRLLNYESPLNIESAWEAYLWKEENYLLKKRLISGRIYMGIAIGLLLSLSTFLFVQNMTYKSRLSPNLKLATKEISPPPIQLQHSKPSAVTVWQEGKESRKSLNSSDKVNKSGKISTQQKPVVSDFTTNKHTQDKIAIEEERLSLQRDSIGKTHLLELPIPQATTTPFKISSKALDRLIPLRMLSQNFQAIEGKAYLQATKENKSNPKTANREEKSTKRNPYKENFVLLEFLGQGGFYSLNYGRLLKKSRLGGTELQMGISFNPKRFNGRETGMIPFLLPISLNQSLKIREEHYLRIGAGPTLVNDRLANEGNDFYLMGNLKLGYRYQKLQSPYFFQIGMLSIHSFSNIFIKESNRFRPSESSLWGEIGIGYKF
ncbi:MAG: hypothetical protein AAF696_13385, partial [Bacteroidota bacterium]